MTVALTGLLFVLVTLGVLNVLSQHRLAIAWKRTDEPTRINDLQREPWANAATGEVNYHRIFVQNMEEIDLRGPYVIEISTVAGDMELKHGPRIFAGPCRIQLTRTTRALQFSFDIFPAATTWVIELRLLRESTLRARVWERAPENAEPTERPRRLRTIEEVDVEIGEFANDHQKRTYRPTGGAVWAAAGLSIGGFALLRALSIDDSNLWVGLSMLSASDYVAMLILTALIWLIGITVRRAPAPFLQGFLYPTVINFALRFEEPPVIKDGILSSVRVRVVDAPGRPSQGNIRVSLILSIWSESEKKIVKAKRSSTGSDGVAKFSEFKVPQLAPGQHLVLEAKAANLESLVYQLKDSEGVHA